MSEPKFCSSREITFLGRQFYIDETVHRPRTSTEFITKAGYMAYINQLDGLTVAADIGIGCGVTAISCALGCPSLTKIYGIDLYDEALAVAKRNVEALQVGSKVDLLQGDLFVPLLNTPVKVIIANLPFASTAKVEAIKLEQPKPDEPLSGIHGGETGFELYERMFDQLKSYQYIDQVLGIWVFCGTEHMQFVNRRHKERLSDFKLMAFQDKFKPHFSHFLFTRVGFNPGPELTRKS